MENKITKKQIEAYRLVYIVGLTQEEAGKMMCISRRAVGRILERLKKNKPELFEHEKYRINFNKCKSFSDMDEDKVVKKW